VERNLVAITGGSMGPEKAVPCRHRGAPPDEVVDRVINLIENVALDEQYLYPRGLSSGEFRLALPVAIERMRGSQSANNSERRDFLNNIFSLLATSGAISSFTSPTYGADTIYRLTIPTFGDVAIIQKGCPDGRHSTAAWTAPDWAAETYIWWLCPSLKNEPGWHVSAGVKRLRREFFSNRLDTVDGVIFHNNTCGTDLRPCPKMAHAVQLGDLHVPPPCIWTMPIRSDGREHNWSGDRKLRFPSVLLSSFGINSDQIAQYTGHIGFKSGAREERTNITSRFGVGRSTTSRS
jgi:hypothetical protein